MSFVFVLFQFAIGYNKYGYSADLIFLTILLFPLVYSYFARFKEIIVYFSISYLFLNGYYLCEVNLFAPSYERPKFKHFDYLSLGKSSLPNIYHFLIDEASFHTYEEIASEGRFDNLKDFDDARIEAALLSSAEAEISPPVSACCC